jgi:hypothetical protein
VQGVENAPIITILIRPPQKKRMGNLRRTTNKVKNNMKIFNVILIILAISINSNSLIKGSGEGRIIRIETVNNKVTNINLYVSEILTGDTYKCQMITHNSIIPNKYYILKPINVSCFNILETQIKNVIQQQILGKKVKVSIYDRVSDTIVGDIT